ncbi:MAG TPA: D-alanine--D-alanine ligase family protein [Treponema sp.]|nr:D-alanine--D-alanine ligase family protein [Treponema sp.]
MEKSKKTVAVIYGGRSGEHEVSLISAASVVRNLDKEQYKVLLIGIDKQGVWYLQNEAELRRCLDGAAALEIQVDETRRISAVCGGGTKETFSTPATGPIAVDVVFPVLHGTFGEDGTIQGLFEMVNVPYVGAGVLGSSIGMDKEIAKILWLHAGLPVVPFISVRKLDWASTEKRKQIIERAERDFMYPLFVKPSCAGSSVGASKAPDRPGLEQAVAEALLWDDKVLIEPFVPAREVECSVTGNERPEAYTPGEIIPTHEFYDYEAKYIDPDGAALLIPADLTETEFRTIREIAIKAYKAAELSGLSRIDFFVRKDTREILLNEVNTMPGFTTISMFPKMCEASGLSYPDLLDKLINLAQERHEQRNSRNYSYKNGKY